MGLLAPKGIFRIKKAELHVGNFAGLLVGNFEKNPYQDPTTWAWLEMYFTPRRYEFYTNTFLLSHFVSVCYPEMYPESSRCGPFEA